MRNTMKAVFFATATLFGINSYGEGTCGSGQYNYARITGIRTNEAATNGKFTIYFHSEEGTDYYAGSAPGFGTETPGGKNNFDQVVDAGKNGLVVNIWCKDGDVVSIATYYGEPDKLTAMPVPHG